ncbi:TPA: phage major capsid protein, partial [Streptococcus pyogenes]
MKKSLVELLEARQKATDELAEVKLKKATIEAKMKSSTNEDDDLEQLKTDTDNLVTQATDIKKTIAELDSDIEKTEGELSKAATIIKEKQKGKTPMDYLKTKTAALDFVRILMDN